MLQTLWACLQMLGTDPIRGVKGRSKEHIMPLLTIHVQPKRSQARIDRSDSSSSTVSRAPVEPGEQATLASIVKEETSQKPPRSIMLFQVLGDRGACYHVPACVMYMAQEVGICGILVMEVCTMFKFLGAEP